MYSFHLLLDRFCLPLTGSSADNTLFQAALFAVRANSERRNAEFKLHCENDPRVEQVLLCATWIDHHPREFQ